MAGNKTFEKGEVICKEGAYELWMYEVIKGSVAVYRDYGLTTQEKIADVDKGYIGEMGLINSMPRIATVVANETTEVSVIGEDDFVEYFKNPEKTTDMFLCLVERLNKINSDYMDACATVRDYLKAEEANAPKSGSLVEAMKKFAAAFRN
ncbi:MAG: cyclic nucleotide-binding domain-containing protein [Lachnospiraceae bacterium]|nr:cyclic nucleotide-binding domain-containing protein [Candidatus Colinaster equi]